MTRWHAGLFLAIGFGGPAAAGAQVAAPAAPRTIAAAPDEFFTRGDARLRYREAGRGDPVVLLHGYTQRIELMLDLADSLSGGFRVIVLDERGHGESSKFADPSRYGQAMVEDVVALLDHLGIRRAHLVGHSMGAAVAAQVALHHPDRVASASLLAGPFFPDSAAFARLTEPFVQDLKSGRGLVAFIKWIFPGIPDSLAVGFNAQGMAVNDLGSLIASLSSMGNLVVPPGEKPPSSTRVLIAVGTGDPLLPQSQALKQRWPEAVYLELPGINHAEIRARGATVAAIRRVVRGRP